MYCKLIGKDMKTRHNTRWKEGIPNEVKSLNPNHGHDYFLYHPHPLLAMMLRSFFGCEEYTELYEVIPEGIVVEYGGSCHCTKLTLRRKLEVPQVSLNQIIGLGLLCAQQVYQSKDFLKWTNNWVQSIDRSIKTASEFCFNRQYGHYPGYCLYYGNNSYSSVYARDSAYDSVIENSAIIAGNTIYYTLEAMPKLNLVELAQEAMKIK